jgi:hypothetical protein
MLTALTAPASTTTEIDQRYGVGGIRHHHTRLGEIERGEEMCGNGLVQECKQLCLGHDTRPRYIQTRLGELLGPVCSVERTSLAQLVVQAG